jgi:hypothetical protein
MASRMLPGYWWAVERIEVPPSPSAPHRLQARTRQRHGPEPSARREKSRLARDVHLNGADCKPGWVMLSARLAHAVDARDLD